MKNNHYKILVLSNLREKSAQALRYAAKLSNEIGANVEVFYAKSATEVAQTEDPLSAISTIAEVSKTTEQKLKDLVNPISKENNIEIKTTFAYGNVKNEIKNYIKTSQPDMIILGERERKKPKFLGNNVTGLVHKNYEGVVFVASDKTIFNSKGEVSLDSLGLKDNIANYNLKSKKELTA
ncbi:universal stress protein [Hyunsoonleella flava]|uniref:Universal stress protein n=1 Tax=Hyunsoonleella flava TaxID=2527939 RepID=A0A4Q9FCC2_9FLAO|nr:universal stress protein [Hyunsoonleella flava]TBN02432.1 universal stress protein [Hyunsoonleella flava]